MIEQNGQNCRRPQAVYVRPVLPLHHAAIEVEIVPEADTDSKRQGCRILYFPTST
jgi:hypothetical protein